MNAEDLLVTDGQYVAVLQVFAPDDRDCSVRTATTWLQLSGGVLGDGSTFAAMFDEWHTSRQARLDELGHEADGWVIEEYDDGIMYQLCAKLVSVAGQMMLVGEPGPRGLEKPGPPTAAGASEGGQLSLPSS